MEPLYLARRFVILSDPIFSLPDVNPSTKEVSEAQEVINDFESADEGIVQVDGLVVDKPVVDQLRDLVARAEVAEE